MPDWTVALDANPDLSLRAKILEPLAAFNDATAGPDQPGLLAVTVWDGSGGVIGGLWGRVARWFLHVELLALGRPGKAGLDGR